MLLNNLNKFLPKLGAYLLRLFVNKYYAKMPQ